MSGLSRGDAYAVLELPIGADFDAIRTSYKRLANKWHPEKHPKSVEALKLFQKISHAFRRLIEDSDRELMDAKEMYSLYQQTVYSNKCHSGVMDNYSESDDGDSDSSYEEYENCSQHKTNGLTEEERQRFANELISEEEKRKKKLEKRRLKKKQRREKKRLEKQNIDQNQKIQDVPKKNGQVKDDCQSQFVKETKSQNNTQNDHSPKSDSEDSNLNTAFYTQVSKKKKPTSDIEVNKSADIRQQQQPVIRNEEIGDAIIIQSRQFAIEGNTRANGGQFREAVVLFSKAISLDSSDFRFFGNRSFCYERLEEYDKSLADSNKAISIAPDWPKGYFRKGKALIGLKNYADAEDAFMHVLKLDMKCADAKHELCEVRIQQLIEMGFRPLLARSAIVQHGTVQQALDSLLAGLVSEQPSLDDVYISDSDESPQLPPTTVTPVAGPTRTDGCLVDRPADRPPANPQTKASSVIITGSQLKFAPLSNSHQQKAPPLPPIPQHHYEQAQNQILVNKQADNLKMKSPRNPEGLTSLWVGNVLPEVPQDELIGMFSKFGKLQSVKCLPDKFCAFVNFSSKECAGKAMEALQGIDCCGQKLLIKFPDNPLTFCNGTEKFSSKVSKVPPPTAVGNNKISGPVNGNECYFWRTTGCQFATSCRYRHVPDHKGIDRKPWHKSK